MHLGAVVPKVPLVGVGRVALVLSGILVLELSDVQQDRISLEPLHIDLFAPDTLCILGIKEGGVLGADDLYFLIWGRGQVNVPLEILLQGTLVATHIACNGDVVTSHPVKRPFLNSHYPLAEAKACLQRTKQCHVLCSYCIWQYRFFSDYITKNNRKNGKDLGF